jgi:hypothetical protein
MRGKRTGTIPPRHAFSGRRRAIVDDPHLDVGDRPEAKITKVSLAASKTLEPAFSNTPTIIMRTSASSAESCRSTRMPPRP